MLNRIDQDNWINPVGYCNRIDVTNLNERYLTAGSQNVLIENIDDQTTRVMTRWGFSRCRRINFSGDGKFINSWRWDNNNGETLYFVTYYYLNGLNTYVFKNSLCDGQNVVTYGHGVIGGDYNSINGLGVRYTSWYDQNNIKEIALFVDGTRNVNYYDSLGNAGNTLFDVGFMTFTTPPPASYTVDYIATYRNQVYYGSRNSRVVYVSSCDDYTDLSYTTSGRLSCEGAEILLDSSCRGFGLQNGNLNIFTDKHHVYEVDIETNTSFANAEEIRVRRLKTSSGQGAMSQELITEIKNGIVYITKEKTVDILSEIENFSSIQAKPINDIVQTDFDNFDYEDAKIFYHKRNIYFTFPKNSVVMVYNLERGMWQPPQIMAIGGFMSIDDELYGFEYIIDRSADFYYMDCFNGYNKNYNDLAKNDDGASFTAVIVTPYSHLGVRNHKKFHNEIFVEGYINSVSEIEVKCLYDYGGYGQISSKTIHGYARKGDRLEFIKQPVDTLSIGKSQLGANNLSNNEAYIIPKFHRSIVFNSKPAYYERQIVFTGDVYDQRWGIISFSSNASLQNDTNQSVRN